MHTERGAHTLDKKRDRSFFIASFSRFPTAEPLIIIMIASKEHWASIYEKESIKATTELAAVHAS